MKKIFFILCLLAPPAFADRLSLTDISTYLNGLDTAEGAFTQINADGSLSQGKLYIKRPGRIRFEYIPPNDALVIAGGGQVAVFDAKSDAAPTRFPLAATPLSIILDRDVDLTQQANVIAHDSDGTRTLVTLQDANRPEMGYLQMIFTANPTQLRQWVVTDEANAQTTVILGDWVVGQRIPNIRFNILAEMRERGFDP
ncbi:MAG: outer membrane lipoprotein carrier protein LolA, partial [Pseudomonadota bacterium]